jgi:hypothetical protein
MPGRMKWERIGADDEMLPHLAEASALSTSGIFQNSVFVCEVADRQRANFFECHGGIVVFDRAV